MKHNQFQISAALLKNLASQLLLSAFEHIWEMCYVNFNRYQYHASLRLIHTPAMSGSHSHSLPGFCSMKQLRVLLLPLYGMLVHCRVTRSSMSPVPIYTPGWRETMWGKVSCLRKQHNCRDSGP